MQWKREKLDYTFNFSPNIAFIQNDIGFARDHMVKYAAVTELHRRAFAVYVLFGEDRHEKKAVSA